MALHELKTWPESFEKVRSGKKLFELRKNDRNYQVGDTLRLLEWRPNSEQYTGESEDVLVTYICEGGRFGVPPDLCVMSVMKLSDVLPSFKPKNPLWDPAIHIHEVMERMKTALHALDDVGAGAAIWCIRDAITTLATTMEQLANLESSNQYNRGNREGLRDGRRGCLCDKTENGKRVHCPVHD